MRPLQEFLQTEASGGILLLVAAVVALAWVNAPWGDSYDDLWSAHLDLGHLHLTLREWINDLLMALFFFVVGLEIKREVLQGELADVRRAALPVAAALGGMVVPAIIFTAFNFGGDGARGWGIPMATDIAFAVGVMALLGARAPLGLKVFLLALAIVDDLGAIAVIAVFYTSDLQLEWLALAAVLLVVTAACVRAGVTHVLVYAALGLATWLAVFESGVHATIAGVAFGLLMPLPSAGPPPGAVDATDSAQTPMLSRLEAVLHPWTSFAIVPLFALANAGVVLGGDAVADAATAPVALGVAAGLVLGKPLGITLFAFVAVRIGIASLPEGVVWRQILGVGMIAGIGFTVAIFISGLAFTDPAMIDEAKIGILAGSTVIGAAGFVFLWRSTTPNGIDPSVVRVRR